MVADNRKPHTHPLREGESKPFIGTRHDIEIGSRKDRLHIIRRSTERNTIFQVGRSNYPLHFLLIASAILCSPEFERPVGELCGDLGECLDQQMRALVVAYHTPNKDDLVHLFFTRQIRLLRILRNDVADGNDAHVWDVFLHTLGKARQEHLEHGTAFECGQFLLRMGLKQIDGIAVRHDNDGRFDPKITEEHLRRARLKTDNDIGLYLIQYRRHILLDVFRKKFIVDAASISLSECTQHLALDLEHGRERAVRSAKMLEIVRRHTFVKRIEKRPLAVVRVDRRHRMPAPHHLVRKRDIHLRRSARISDHL